MSPSAWLPVPTGRFALVAAVASLAVAAFPGDSTNGLLAINALLVAVALADWWAAPRPSSVSVERRLPAIVALGQQAEVSWTVTNPGGSTVRLALADQLAPSLRAAHRRVVMTVPGRGRATATTTVRPQRRGRFEVSELAVRVEGRLGLAARQERLVQPATLRVYPPFASRDEAELRIDKARILEVGLRSAKGRGGGTEFDAMRE